MEVVSRLYYGLMLYWGKIGVMEKKMETTVMGLFRVWGLGLLLGCVLVWAAVEELS